MYSFLNILHMMGHDLQKKKWQLHVDVHLCTESLYTVHVLHYRWNLKTEFHYDMKTDLLVDNQNTTQNTMHVQYTEHYLQMHCTWDRTIISLISFCRRWDKGSRKFALLFKSYMYINSTYTNIYMYMYIVTCTNMYSIHVCTCKYVVHVR